jgi:transposase
VTVFKIVADGSAALLRPLFTSVDGILVTDRGTVFTFWKMNRRQICWAHLLRKFVSFSERPDKTAAAFGAELLGYADLVFTYWNQYKDGKIDNSQFQLWMDPVKRHFEGCIERAIASKIERLAGSCLDILNHREALWTFMAHNGVTPTNNHAERELREFVLWRKRCFGAQSERGNRFAERIMTISHTARKQKCSVFAFLTTCCEAMQSSSPLPLLLPAA